MNRKFWYGIWAILFATCGVLGFVSEADGVLRVLLTLLALAFFVPPAVLLCQAIASGDRKTIRRIRNLSALSLLMTLVLMVVNIVTALRVSDVTGKLLHILLVIVSSPMKCMGNGLVSLFAWACVLMVGIQHSRKRNHGRK